MGNTYVGVSNAKLLEYEERLIEHSDIQYSEFLIENVVIDMEGNYVRTF
jgi:hypothetical protein